MPETTDRKVLANSPFAAAMRRARADRRVSVEEWAELLSDHGAPASRDQAWGWESGRIIVPAYALAAAARASGRSLGDLLVVSESGEPLSARLGALEARTERAEEKWEALAEERGDRLTALETLVAQILELPEIRDMLERRRDELTSGQD